MRLLYLSPTAAMGGAERVLLDLTLAIRRSEPSWVLGLIVAGDGPLADAARAAGVKTTVLPFPRQLSQLGDAGLGGVSTWTRFVSRAAVGAGAMFGYSRALRRAIDAFRPDVIHSNGFKMHIAGALAGPAPAALLWHFHDYPGSRRVASVLVKRLKGRCQSVVAVSGRVASDVRAVLGSGPAIDTIPNGVDTARFSPDGARANLDALAGLPAADHGVVRVGLVGTFAKWKGHLAFLELIQTLRRSHAVRGYIVGGPVYETEGSQYAAEELRGAIARLGLIGEVGLTGFIPDTAGIYRALDVVVHASTAPEPFGLVVAEGMAAGRAVVVSDTAGVSELVTDGRDVFKYPQGNVHALSAQVGRLVEDEMLRRRVGEAARATAVQRFDTERVANAFARVYARFEQRAAA